MRVQFLHLFLACLILIERKASIALVKRSSLLIFDAVDLNLIDLNARDNKGAGGACLGVDGTVE